jgi:cell division protein ZapA (FtsZ GTPase activity inhibitor)
MQQVQPTLTITIDNQSFEVATMSEQVRQMITYMDDWRQKESDLSSELLMSRSALRDIQNTLLTTIRQEQEAAAAAVAVDAAPVDVAPYDTAPVDVAPVDFVPYDTPPADVAPVVVAPFVDTAPVDVPAPVDTTPVAYAAPVDTVS